jgi:hypothetical protein
MKNKLAEAVVDTLLTASEDELFEMANVHPEDSGLRQIVWFSTNLSQPHHRPRGKVGVKRGKSAQWYPFSIDDPIQWLVKAAPGVTTHDFARIAEFVRLNREVVLAYWNGTVSTRQFLDRLQKLD